MTQIWSSLHPQPAFPPSSWDKAILASNAANDQDTVFYLPTTLTIVTSDKHEPYNFLFTSTTLREFTCLLLRHLIKLSLRKWHRIAFNSYALPSKKVKINSLLPLSKNPLYYRTNDWILSLSMHEIICKSQELVSSPRYQTNTLHQWTINTCANYLPVMPLFSGKQWTSILPDPSMSRRIYSSGLSSNNSSSDSNSSKESYQTITTPKYHNRV